MDAPARASVASSPIFPRTAGGLGLPPAEGRARASVASPREHFSRFPGRTACGPPRSHLARAWGARRQVACDGVYVCLVSEFPETGVIRRCRCAAAGWPAGLRLGRGRRRSHAAAAGLLGRRGHWRVASPLAAAPPVLGRHCIFPHVLGGLYASSSSSSRGGGRRSTLRPPWEAHPQANGGRASRPGVALVDTAHEGGSWAEHRTAVAARGHPGGWA